MTQNDGTMSEIGREKPHNIMTIGANENGSAAPAVGSAASQIPPVKMIVYDMALPNP